MLEPFQPGNDYTIIPGRVNIKGIIKMLWGQGASQRAILQAMAASHASQHGNPCESTYESHSYWKLNILKWVLRLENCLSEMGA